MHEYGIAEQLLASVERTLSAHGGHSPTRIVVAVGSDVDSQSLLAAFDVLTRGTEAAGADLVLEAAVSEMACLDCQSRSLVPASSCPETGVLAGEASCERPACPTCGSTLVVVAPGPGPILRSIEMEV